jgi:hypothetical protein
MPLVIGGHLGQGSLGLGHALGDFILPFFQRLHCDTIHTPFCLRMQ